jgi:ElaB/YqjD/DUF883 family membrane-anchored ribosome-binding protein
MSSAVPPLRPESVEPILVNSVAVSKSKGVERHDPAKAVLALEMMSLGTPMREVKEATGFTTEQLASLRGRHKQALEVRRQQLSDDNFELVELIRQAAVRKTVMLLDNEKELAKVNLRDLVLPLGIVQDKAFQAIGENKQVVEHRVVKASLEDVQKEIEAAREEMRKGAIEVVVEESKEMGGLNNVSPAMSGN